MFVSKGKVHKKIVIRSEKQRKIFILLFSCNFAHCGKFFAFLESLVLVDKDARSDESLANTSLVLVDENGQLKFTTGIDLRFNKEDLLKF